MIPTVKTWRLRLWHDGRITFETTVRAPTRTLAKLATFDTAVAKGVAGEYLAADCDKVTWSIVKGTD